jgi:hypothetical protein
MVMHRTKPLRRFGTLGVAMIVAVASLMLGAAPASAAGYTHYENVGNPGWCLDGDGTEAYLHRCGHGDIDYQLWFYTSGMDNLQLVHAASGNCLVAYSSGWVALGQCTGSESRWDARGKNGWVMLWNRRYGGCLVPWGTGAPGDETYPIVLDPEPCDPGNLGNVPNLRAWRYFA